MSYSTAEHSLYRIMRISTVCADFEVLRSQSTSDLFIHAGCSATQGEYKEDVLYHSILARKSGTVEKGSDSESSVP
jgi:hypothetical protein